MHSDRGAMAGESTDVVLDSCHDLLAGVLDAWTRTASQLRELPPPESPAGREDAYLVAHHPEWNAHEAVLAGTNAMELIAAAACHINGLKSLLRARTVELAAWPLVRAAVEHISMAGWLLDPNVSAEGRVARRWMLKLADAHRARRFAQIRRAGKADIQQIKQDRDRIRDELVRYFPNSGDMAWPYEDALPQWTVAGQTYPTLASACRTFANYAGIHNVPGLYDLLSLLTHPNLHSALMVALDISVHDTWIDKRYRADPEQTARMTKLTAAILFRAGMTVASYFHLDDQPLRQWSAQALSA